jgi:hypothetical protein
MSQRLTSAVLISALLRQTSQLGGFAAVLHKGDPTSGSILVIAAEKGVVSSLWERILGAQGAYKWTESVHQDIENKAFIDDYVVRRRKNDPDVWVVELDVPERAQFTAVLDAIG